VLIVGLLGGDQFFRTGADSLSKRVPNEYCDLASTPLSVEMLPFPSLRLPFHSAEAFRFYFDLLRSSISFEVSCRRIFAVEIDAIVVVGATVFCRSLMDCRLHA
jgi:hypothetical protein